MQQVHLGKAMKNDMWITENEVKDPTPLPELPGYHILIRPVSIKGVTKGGIVLPDSTRDDMAYLTTVGKVISIGDLAYQDEIKFPNGAWCQNGDYVCYAKHAGQKLFFYYFIPYFHYSIMFLLTWDISIQNLDVHLEHLYVLVFQFHHRQWNDW